MDYAVFMAKKMPETHFEGCRLKEVDFTQCDLSKAVFDKCDLEGAVFDRTILEKADFRSAENYRIDPENNRIKKAKFSVLGLEGLLGIYDIDIS